MSLDIIDMSKPDFISHNCEFFLYEDKKLVSVMFVSSGNEGQGNFRKALDEFEEKYKNKTIWFPTPFARLHRILQIRGGYEFKKVWIEEAEDTVEVFEKRTDNKSKPQAEKSLKPCRKCGKTITHNPIGGGVFDDMCEECYATLADGESQSKPQEEK